MCCAAILTCAVLQQNGNAKQPQLVNCVCMCVCLSLSVCLNGQSEVGQTALLSPKIFFDSITACRCARFSSSLCLSVCLSVCMYVCLYVCISVCVCVCVCVRARACTCACEKPATQCLYSLVYTAILFFPFSHQDRRIMTGYVPSPTHKR